MNESNAHRGAWPRLKNDDQVACHFCDALHRCPTVKEGESALCSQCGAVLFANRKNTLSRVVSYSGAAIIFTILVHSFPIVKMSAFGNFTQLSLLESIHSLILDGEYILAGLVFLFTVAAPLMLTVGLLYVVFPLMYGKILPGAMKLNIWIQRSSPWAMLEVFLLGFIVSLLKLGHIAELHFGIGLWSLIALVFCITAAMSAIDHRELWDRLEFAKARNSRSNRSIKLKGRR